MSLWWINTILDSLVFLLTGAKFYFGHTEDFGFMTRLGLFLGSGWLVADDFDLLDSFIRGGYAEYSLSRTGVFKAAIIFGLVLDLLRLKLKKNNSLWIKGLLDIEKK